MKGGMKTTKPIIEKNIFLKAYKAKDYSFSLSLIINLFFYHKLFPCLKAAK
jgi:hypothetical protein